MILSFAKLKEHEAPFLLQNEALTFEGTLTKKSSSLALCKGKISGELPHQCDRCGDEILLNLDDDVKVLCSDGIIDQSEQKLENIVEFYDGQINVDDIFISELESIKSDYFYCKNCK